MAYLIDTNIISETMKPSPNAGVLKWMALNSEASYLSAISFGELSYGVRRLPEGRRKRNFQQWLNRVEELMSGRILAYNRQVAGTWAELQNNLIKEGQSIPAMDSLIAATADYYQLTLVTRNTKDFQATGVNLLNPFE